MGLFGGGRKSTNATSTAPPEETGSQFTSDQMIRVVTLTARKDEAKSVRLADVVKDPRWAEAVAQSPLANHHLSAMCVAVPRNAAPARRVSATVPSPSPCAARFLTLGRARASWSFARRAREFPGPLGRDVSPLRSPARRASIPPLRRTYDEFVSHAKARTLSYRFGTPLELDCECEDPARELARVRAALPLTPLDTPPDGWTHLWVDAFCHLGDPAGVSSARDISAQLYLHVPALPQYWLGGDVLAASKAMTRAWIHQELAYGRLDRDALERFFRICAASYAAQTSAPGYDGDGSDLDGPRLMARLVARRIKAASSEEASEPDLPQCAVEWWARVRGFEGVPALATADDTDDECELQLKELMFNLSARQVSDDPRVNADALASDPAFAWAVIRSYANDNCHDPADMYVASLGAVSVACGFPLPRDPLAAHRAKRREGPTHHPDGTLAFVAEDVDVDALNANHAVLRACWSAVFRSKDAGKRVPALVLGLATHDKTHVDWSCVPPGIATLGLGPVRKERLRGGKVLFGARAGLDFTGAPDSAYGYASRGELSAALDDAGETLAPGEFAADSFGPDHLGFHPRCRWNSSAARDEEHRKDDAEFERTLENLWAAWLKAFDADGSGTISYAELKAFASLESCPSADGYMKSLHEWASEALKNGDLEAEYTRVDADGSGELEYPEFRAMLWTDE